MDSYDAISSCLWILYDVYILWTNETSLLFWLIIFVEKQKYTKQMINFDLIRSVLYLYKFIIIN